MLEGSNGDAGLGLGRLGPGLGDLDFIRCLLLAAAERHVGTSSEGPMAGEVAGKGPGNGGSRPHFHGKSF